MKEPFDSHVSSEVVPSKFNLTWVKEYEAVAKKQREQQESKKSWCITTLGLYFSSGNPEDCIAFAKVLRNEAKVDKTCVNVQMYCNSLIFLTP